MVGLVVLGFATALAASDNPNGALKKGLIAAEAHQDLGAAILLYQEAIRASTQDRTNAATAIFRLGECYRKQGRAKEARLQYERILSEFPEQTELVAASRVYAGRPASTLTPQTKPGSTNFVHTFKKDFGAGPDWIHGRNSQGLTPLHVAAASNYLGIVKFLIDRSVDLNPASSFRSTPLHLAAAKGNMEVVELLIERGAEVDKPNKIGGTPLHAAANFGHPKVIATLSKAGANVHGKNDAGETPLHRAAENNHSDSIKLLLRLGADANATDLNGGTSLHSAAKKNAIAAAGLLLEHKANINAQDTNGCTALHFAVESRSLPMLELLLKNKAQLDLQTSAKFGTNRGYTPLMLAVKLNDQSIVEQLLQAGADPSIPSSKGTSPLHKALEENRGGIALLLIHHKANPHARNHAGATPLHLASARNQIGAAKRLLDAGADVNALDNDGNSSLHLASRFVAQATVKHLIERGANVHAINRAGPSPLGLAEWSRRPKGHFADDGSVVLAEEPVSTTALNVISLLRQEGCERKVARAFVCGTVSNSVVEWNPAEKMTLHTALTKANLTAASDQKRVSFRHKLESGQFRWWKISLEDPKWLGWAKSVSISDGAWIGVAQLATAKTTAERTAFEAHAPAKLPTASQNSPQ